MVYSPWGPPKQDMAGFPGPPANRRNPIEEGLHRMGMKLLGICLALLLLPGSALPFTYGTDCELYRGDLGEWHAGNPLIETSWKDISLCYGCCNMNAQGRLRQPHPDRQRLRALRAGQLEHGQVPLLISPTAHSPIRRESAR